MEPQPNISQPDQSQYQAPMDSAGPSQLSGTKHFLNKKFAITFVILSLLGAGAYAGIWYWQDQQVAQEVVPTFTPRPSTTPDPTADWKTYTNTQYGFEFKYPSDWNSWLDSNNVASIVNLQQKDDDMGSAVISVSATKQLSQTTKPLDSTMVLNKTSDVTYNGIRWSLTFTSDKREPTLRFISATAYHNGYLYNIVSRNYPDTTEKLFDQILSTFKFTDIADTSTWKTYTSPKYGYSIQYPSKWSIDNNRSDEYTIVFDLGVGGESRESVQAIPFSGAPLKDYIKNLNIGTLKQSSMIVAGQPAVKIDTNEFGLSFIVVAHGNYIYRFDTQGAMANQGVLNTFKFTK